MEYKTRLTHYAVGRFAFGLHGIDKVDEAIDAMFAELERRGAPDLLEELCPYFGTVWPSGRSLAEWVAEQAPETFAGKRVLELGCGLALPCFVAAALGAEVTASDLHPDVPSFLQRNLAQNPGVTIRYETLDWRDALGAQSPRFDWILASDVLYERHQPETLARFFRQALSPTGSAVVIDPKRSFWSDLVRQAELHGFTSHVEPRGEKAVLLRFARPT